MKKFLFILGLFLPTLSVAGTHVQEGASFVVGQCLQAGSGDTASTTGSACNSGGSGGIVSPGTFTWVNNFGIQVSTFVSNSTYTINGPMIASGTVGTAGQVLASQGPGQPPTFIDPIVSQATYTLLNAAVRVTDAQGVILGTSTANPFYTFVTNPSTVPINVSISSGSGPSGTVLTLSGRVIPQTVGTIKSATDVVSVFVSSFSNVTFMITPGTSTGITVNFETSIDSGTNWVSLICNRVSTYNTESSYTLDTTTNVWTSSIIGATNFRVRTSAWSAGISTVTIQVTGDPVSQSISVGQPTASQLRASVNIDGSSNTVKVIQSTVGVVTTGIALQVVSTQTFTVQPIGITTVTFNGASQPVSLQNEIMVDSSAFTLGTSSAVPQSGLFIPVPTALVTTSTLTAGVRIGKFRSQYVTLMDDNNVILGTATSNPVITHDSGTVTVTGTVSAVQSGNFIITQSTVGAIPFTNGSSVSVANPLPVQSTGTTTVTGTVAATQSGTWTVQPGNTQNTTSWIVSSTWSVAVASNIYNNTLTAATTGLVQLSADENQRLLVTGIPRGQVRRATATITVNTEVVLISSGAAGVFDDICGCIFANTSATAVRLDMRGQTGAGNIDGTWYLPAGDTRGFWPGCQNPFVQLVPAAQWSVQASASVTDVRITCQYIPIK